MLCDWEFGNGNVSKHNVDAIVFYCDYFYVVTGDLFVSLHTSLGK